VWQAGLIICYAGTGRTASLIAKYRPTVPILALVVPHLKSKGLSWELEGRFLARQFQIMRGSQPVPLKLVLVHAWWWPMGCFITSDRSNPDIGKVTSGQEAFYMLLLMEQRV
jgi:hypothetical protein